MTIELPPDLHPKAIQALEEFVRRCQDGFTGSLQFEFTSGIPVLGRYTNTVRFGKEHTHGG